MCFFPFWSISPLDILPSIFLSPSSNCSRFWASCYWQGIQTGWWRDETSRLKYFKQKLWRFHQSHSAKSFIISVHRIINHTLVAKTDVWPPRKRGPDFKCGREGARTKAHHFQRETALLWIHIWFEFRSKGWCWGNGRTGRSFSAGLEECVHNRWHQSLQKATWTLKRHECLAPAKSATNGTSASCLWKTDGSFARYLLLLFICLWILTVCIII